MRFQFKKTDVLPKELTMVIIRAKQKITTENSLPFEVFSGYYYKDKWHLSGQIDFDVFHEYYEVTGWAHYQFTFNKKQ